MSELLVAVAAGLLTFGIVRAITHLRRARARTRMLRAAIQRRRPQPRRSLRQRVAASGFSRSTERALSGSRQWRKTAVLLDRAALPLRPAELLFAMAAAGVFAVSMALALGFGALAVPLAAAAGAAGPFGAVAFRARRRLRAFEEQLPEILMTLSGSLKAGQSFNHALQAVADEGQEPASRELRVALGEARLGRPLEEALGDAAERLGSSNFAFVASAVTIQREVGGSLAGIFDMVAETVRARHQFARRLKALTAMGRMSAYVLIALPIGIGVVITILSPDYMAALYGTSTGRTLLMISTVMMILGALVLRRMVAFKT